LSEFYIPTFRNTVFSNFTGGWVWRISSYLPAYEDGTDSVPECWSIKFRRRGITRKKAYNIQKMAKVWNQEWL